MANNRFDELAEALLPCKHDVSLDSEIHPAIAFDCHHDQFDCPAFYRPAVNAALRTLRAETLEEAEQPFHRVIGLLRDQLLPHGLCQPRERRACTNCNAKDELAQIVKDYKGAKVKLAALTNTEPPSPWRAIESAPKDGTAILICIDGPIGNAQTGPIVGEASWIENGWWWAGNDPSDYYGGQIGTEPRAWCPLPAPPPVG